MNALLLTLAAAVPPGRQSQVQDPCTLLTADQVQALAKGHTIPPGTSQTVSGPMGVTRCRYEWGTAGQATAGKYTLDVTLSDAAKAYPGAKPGDIKEALARPAAGDPPAIILPKTGDGAYFKSSGTTRSDAVALVNGMVLEITLQGPGASGKRNQVIALLRSAVQRF
jgi:hypothetical protein